MTRKQLIAFVLNCYLPNATAEASPPATVAAAPVVAETTPLAPAAWSAEKVDPTTTFPIVDCYAAAAEPAAIPMRWG